MRFLPLLLRILLCVSLVANGIGFAQGSTRMQLAHASHGERGVRLDVASASAGACHPRTTLASQASASMAAMDHGTGHGDGDGDASKSGPSTGDPGSVDPADCCDGSTCQCQCTAQASTAFVAEVSAGATLVKSAIVIGGTSRHASPRLADLIRPPIG